MPTASLGGRSRPDASARPLKLLWIGYFRDTRDGDKCDEQRMARALERVGVDVTRCDAPWDDAERMLEASAPDWVFFSKCKDFARRRLRRMRASAPGVPFGQILFDLMDHRDRVLRGVPWLRRSRLSWWLPLARDFDLVFMRERGHFDRYAELGVRCVYLDQACDPEEEPVDHASARCDIAFFGNYYPSRDRALRALSERHQVCVHSIYPSPWRRAGFDAHPGVFGMAFAEAVASARIVYGESATHDVDGYWSDRVYRVLGRRGFFLTRYTPGLEESFRNHEHLVWYEREEELRPLVARYLADPGERKRIAESGFRHVRSHHTYDVRAREMLEHLLRPGRRPR